MTSLENALSAASNERPTLREGSRGTQVVELQHKLAAAGFSPGAADGIFGVATKNAVLAFQGSRGLERDGIVGPITWRALDAGSSKPPPSGGISLQQLCAIMTNLSDARARECIGHLNSAMSEAQINNWRRHAAFLAQIAHESGELKYFEELASGDAYEGRQDLGNTQPGDGRRYKGRGPIQLTGRNNYRDAGKALHIDLEGHPQRAGDLDVGFRIAGWFWTRRGLNALADAGEFREITRRINGGYTGIEARIRYYERAKRLLS